jgi:hypothetical protein
MLPERIAAKIKAEGDCWQWTGAYAGKGYGGTWLNGRHYRAHRAVWELLVGPISEGMTLDHLCRNRRCVNPAHLEPVAMRENIMRGEGVGARNARKTHCPLGHPYEGGNLYVAPDGQRRCRICMKRYRVGGEETP